ncbi:MAG TPA: LmeA family phospholipid-binding protein [Galbitalea sp.]|nr:LmeA family phospholipid-binding protein [Galbitalea sp.]
MSTVVEVPRRKHRGRRALIALLVVVLVLLVGFFVADYFAKKAATAYVQQQVATALDLSSTAPVAVDLGPGSILVQAATGSIDDVTVTVDPLVIDGLSGTANLTAHGVPLSSTTPVKTLNVNITVPESTIDQAITEVPALKQFKPVVTIAGSRVAVNGTVYILGFAQKIGVTLIPTVSAGKPGFAIKTAEFDGATISVAQLNHYIPGLSAALQSATSLCIANALPKSFVLTGITLQGKSLVSTFSGDGSELNSASLSQKGSCP